MISCIVPARNEQGHLRNVISEILEVSQISQIIIVEGGSIDSTFEEASKLASENPKLIQVMKQLGKGKFDAVKQASKFCRENLIIIWDADGTVPLSSVNELVALALRTNCPVIGDRLRGEIEKGAMFKANYLGNWFFAFLWAPIMGGQIKDLLCGTKIFTREVYLSIPESLLRHDPFGDFALLLSSRLIGQKVLSHKVKYLKRQYGSTNIHRWSDGLRLLKVTLVAYLVLTKSKFLTK